MFYEKGAVKNIAIFTGKHLCWSLGVRRPSYLQFYSKETPTHVFS